MKKEVKIGLTVIAGVLVIYLALTWVKSMHLFAGKRQACQISFQDVSGLKEGDPVTVYGYPSGNVRTINLGRGSVLVTVDLDIEADLRADAIAEVRIKELLGGKLIAINPGTSAQKLAQNAVIKGTTSMDFASAFSKFGEFLENMEGQDLDSLLLNINKIAATFAELGEEFRSLDTQGLLKDVREAGGSLNRILSDAERRNLTGKIDRSLGQVEGLSQRADITLAAISRLTDQISSQTLPSTDKVLLQASKMLDDVEGIMTDLRDMMQQLKDPNSLAGRFLYDAEMSKDFDATVVNLNKTLEHLRNKKVYVTMTLGKRQRDFEEEAREKEEKKKKKRENP